MVSQIFFLSSQVCHFLCWGCWYLYFIIFWLLMSSLWSPGHLHPLPLPSVLCCSVLCNSTCPPWSPPTSFSLPCVPPSVTFFSAQRGDSTWQLNESLVTVLVLICLITPHPHPPCTRRHTRSILHLNMYHIMLFFLWSTFGRKQLRYYDVFFKYFTQ